MRRSSPNKKRSTGDPPASNDAAFLKREEKAARRSMHAAFGWIGPTDPRIVRDTGYRPMSS
jgi:hypothetical protein